MAIDEGLKDELEQLERFEQDVKDGKIINIDHNRILEFKKLDDQI